MNIREATLADVGRIATMAMRFLDTHFKALMTYDPAELALLILFLIEHGVIFLAERDHANDCAVWCQFPNPERCTMHDHRCNCGPRVVGMLALAIQKHPLNGSNYGDELAWWIEPEWRRGMAGPKILRHAEEWARQKGLSVLKMVAPANDPDVGTFYESRGYVPVEMAYQKVLKEQHDGAVRRGSSTDGGGAHEPNKGLREDGPVGSI